MVEWQIDGKIASNDRNTAAIHIFIAPINISRQDSDIKIQPKNAINRFNPANNNN